MHPVPFYGQDYEKEGLELVTSLFEFQNMLAKIQFLVLPFESGNRKVKKKMKRLIFQEQKDKKNFLEEIKNVVHNF